MRAAPFSKNFPPPFCAANSRGTAVVAAAAAPAASSARLLGSTSTFSLILTGIPIVLWGSSTLQYADPAPTRLAIDAHAGGLHDAFSLCDPCRLAPAAAIASCRCAAP